jgi:putative nucleotidyltransferase with HDIG domain
VENTLLLEDSLQLASLLGELKRRGIFSIEIRRGIELAEFRHFVDLLSLPADAQRAGGAAEYLAQCGVRHLSVGSIPAHPVGPTAAMAAEPTDAYRAGLHLIDDLYAQAAGTGDLNLRRARTIIDSLVDILATDPLTLMRAAVIKNYDPDTAHHSMNVAILALFVGQRLDFSRDQMAMLGVAAMLHDIGKTRVPREILTKASALTQAERALVQQHPIFGAEMLRALAGPSDLSMVVAFEHHANYDLSGYPRLTTKPRPQLFARLVQIVDVFDAATTSRRAYRRPQAPEDVMKHIMAGAATLYDPALARIFVQEMGVYPVGTLVRLDDGALAVVRRPGRASPTRPVVSVIDARATPPAVVATLDLEMDPARQILRSVDPADAGVDPAALPFPPDESAA